jgi:hypothetical protein
VVDQLSGLRRDHSAADDVTEAMAQAQAQDDHRDHQRAVFRSVARGGRVGAAPLSPYPASLVIKRRIAAIGLDPATYSGHSLRSGFLTSAGRGGASLFKLTEVSRHKSLDTLRGYVRRVDLFKEHAGAAFL